MLTPIRRGDAESFHPEIRNLASEPDVLRSFELGLVKRQEVRKELVEEKNVVGRALGHYARGEGYLGERSEEHQRRLEIRPFADIESAPVWEPPPAGRPSLWKRMWRTF
jgi:hypothetical protein